MSAAEIEASVREQIGRLEAVALRLGGEIVHVKPHGALYNLAARDGETARPIGRAVLLWNPRATVFGLAGSPALGLWREVGLPVAAEAFADRRYEPDGSLRSRAFPTPSSPTHGRPPRRRCASPARETRRPFASMATPLERSPS